MSDIYISNDKTSAQLGTYESPIGVATSEEFDALMRSHSADDIIAWHWNGIFDTLGTWEYGDTNDVMTNVGFRWGRHWTVETERGAMLRWDWEHAALTDVPIKLIMSTEARFTPGQAGRYNHTPEEVWALLPVGQRVRGITLDLQFTKAAARWRAAGRNRLSIGGVALAGHGAAIEGTQVADYGTLGGENFPLYIQGAYGSFDRDLIAELDPATHIFDDRLSDDAASHISGSEINGYDPSSNDQVSCAFIAGSVGRRKDGQWVQTMRRFAFATHIEAAIPDGVPNRVQLVTLYQTLRGQVGYCRSEGLSVGYYGDTYGTRKVDISLNEFLKCQYYGVQLVLSPGGPCPEQYFHDGYKIGPNKITSQGANVLLATLPSAMPTSDKRYIANISVDASLSLENSGATNVTRTGIKPPPRTSHCPW